MDNHKRQWISFLREQHRQVCFEQGDHPDEIDTAYSAGADAIERLHAIESKER